MLPPFVLEFRLTDLTKPQQRTYVRTYYLAAAIAAILAANSPRAEGALNTMYEPASMPATHPHLSCVLFHCRTNAHSQTVD
eukprot:COSAG06_NODE_54553_length_294_cov_0.589744_1_plen_80_part_10